MPSSGHWTDPDLSVNSQILAVHAALLYNGKVLYFSGSEHDEATTDFDHTRLFNPVTEEVERISSPPMDLFCCGQAFLPDGKLLVAGGTAGYDIAQGGGIHTEAHHYWGIRQGYVFDPFHNQWHEVALMQNGRWYPTLTALPSGDVLIMSGHTNREDQTRHMNDTIEVFNVHTNMWQNLGRDRWHNENYTSYVAMGRGYYPRMFLLPNGKVFSIANGEDNTSQSFNISYAGVEDISVTAPRHPTYYDSYDITAVMLPLSYEDNYRTRILVAGKTSPQWIDLGPRAATAVAGWENTSPRRVAVPSDGSGSPRIHCNSVILPDGKILIVGGTLDGTDRNAILRPEIFDPVSNSWDQMGFLAPMKVARVYHSVALLLPDGRVWVSGSNHDGHRNRGGRDAENPDRGDARELSIEIFSPPYLDAGARPVIHSLPGTVGYKISFKIETSDTSNITSVALIRCGAVTHAFDNEQRYIKLRILERTASSLIVESPPDNNIAPAGYYMLFLVNNAGVPSVAKFVKLSSAYHKVHQGLAVSRLNEHLDVFWVGAANRIQSTFWNYRMNGGRWNPVFSISSDNAAAPSTEVVCTARLNEHLDVFWISSDGAVLSNWWDLRANNANWNAVFQIAGPGSASPTGGLSCLARLPEHLDVFWISSDGAVLSNWWDLRANNANWNAVFQIAGPGSASPTGGVASVARWPEHIGVFWIHTTGSVQIAWWDISTGRWSASEEIAPAGSASNHSGIACAARSPYHLDVFWISRDGSIQSTWWDQSLNSGRWNIPFQVAPPGSAILNSKISCLVRHPEHLDVFWIGNDGFIKSNWWDSRINEGRWNAPFNITNINLANTSNPSIYSVARLPEHIDIFWRGSDNRIYSNWWNIHNRWSEPFPIS